MKRYVVNGGPDAKAHASLFRDTGRKVLTMSHPYTDSFFTLKVFKNASVTPHASVKISVTLDAVVYKKCYTLGSRQLAFVTLF